ncbi:MAG: drug/metabolite exporter YedA [Candidatus Velthaea sp.]
MSSVVEAVDGNVAVARVRSTPKAPANLLQLVFALGSVWLFWGSTFAAIRFSIATIPPFVMASSRFLIAGAIVWTFCAFIGKGVPTRSDWRRALVTGTTLLLLGNAVTAWSTQFVPTGLGSLLLSLSPIWMAFFDFLFSREKPTRTALFGMGLGFLGMALLLQPKATGGLPVLPTALLIAASISWAFGSIYQRRSGGSNLVLATAMQMVVGGALIGIEAALFGQWQHFDVHAISAASLGGLAWLVVFGSLFAYSAYLWTMQNAPTSLGSTYAYVNPIVALILGALLFHEHLSPLAMIASVVILGGVALMMVPSRPTEH